MFFELVTGEDDGLFRIYKLDTLFYMLANAVAGSAEEGFPKESLALVQLKKDTFKYTPGLGCEVSAVSATAGRARSASFG